MSVSSTMTDRARPIEIKAGSDTRAMTFSADGEYLVSGEKGIRLRQVKDGKLVAAKGAHEVGNVNCLAVSMDGRWMGAGTWGGNVIVWDAKTHKQAFTLHEGFLGIYAMDFSPDSTRLLAASHHTASVWDLATRKQVQTLHHQYVVTTAKFSPNGDRIATSTLYSVRIWDSSNGRLLARVPVKVEPWLNMGLIWFQTHLFVVSDGNIRQVDASTGSILSQWPVPDFSSSSCIVLPKHGQFIVYAAKRAITLWHTSTHAELALLQHPQDVSSIALSPDDQLLAIGGNGGKIVIHSLSRITDLISLSRLHPTLQEPDIQIDDVVLNLWKHDQLADAEALLSSSRDASHHMLAARALLRAHLRMWDAALVDAEMAINIQPSIVAYIAKSIVHIGKGERDEGYHACDIAFECFRSSHGTFLLLIKAIIVFIAGEHCDALSRMDDLIASMHFNSVCQVVQTYMYLLLGNSCMEHNDYEGAIRSFRRTQFQMRQHTIRPVFVISLIFGWKFGNLGATMQRHLCEALYAAGRTRDAGESLLTMVNTFDAEVHASEPTIKWISNFSQQCLSTLAIIDAPLEAISHGSIPGHHTADNPLNPTLLLLRAWAKATLIGSSWKHALNAASHFAVPRFTIYWIVHEHLEANHRIAEASECFRQMVDDLLEQAKMGDEQSKWVLDCKRRCTEKLERLGDIAMSSKQHDDAISHYMAALALDPATPQGLFIKRSKAYVASDMWEAALDDANKVITLDPLSPWGYERKHAALHKAGDYESAIGAFETMLLMISQSSDIQVRARHRQYVTPAKSMVAIRKAVRDAIRDSPRMLINAISGRLCDKSEQAATFELLPVFKKLISSMTTRIDDVRIEQDVTQYYRYAMFSHKWEDNEPTFERVVHIMVYDLEESPTHDKLKMFCKIVRDAGVLWAWSDTCCINKADHFVLQEALVSMFKWYYGSALTVVFLPDVPLLRLVDSIWNKRAWTFQEYHASKVVRFYNRDWTLYMNIDIPNHKESSEIISEMEEATGIPANALMALQPGLDDIREKLCLASRRETTLIEDAAYSLLGIFSISLPVVYGEGDQALGRLLAQLLTGSGDTSILAWTGKSGSFNSCLPANVGVFTESPSSHIPLSITNSELDTITAGLRVSSLDLTLVMKLYDRLNELRVPSFAGQRMTLPCIVFKLGRLSVSRSRSVCVFRAQTSALGIVEIKTQEDLTRYSPLYLIHPWIDFLLDRQPLGSVMETMPENDQPPLVDEVSPLPCPSSITSADPKTLMARLASHFWLPSFGRWFMRHRDAASLQPPSTISQTNRQIRAVQVIARLKQPFGGLLLTPNLGKVAAYKRVATESMITVQIEKITPAMLRKVIESVCVVDVL